MAVACRGHLNARKSCKNNENLGEYMIEAAETYATLGEICGVLAGV